MISGFVRVVSVTFGVLLGMTPALGQIVLSEIVPANRGGLGDADGDTPDWIEFFNAGSDSVDLTGFSLTDDKEKAEQWRFPASTVGPGEYLVVFASGKDRDDPTGELHANFKLSGSGEFVGLYDSEGKLMASIGPDIPPLKKEQSFGIAFRDGRPISGGTPGVLEESTPGAPNPDSKTVAELRAPMFSEPHGYYSEPFRLTLEAEKSALIRFTLDGTTPGKSSGYLYMSPIPVDATSTVRAIAFGADGRLPSAVFTQTYLFLDDVARQSQEPPPGWPPSLYSRRSGTTNYGMLKPEDVGTTHAEIVEALESLPSLSLVTDTANLWDSQTGIWRNSQNRGPEWERPLSVELLDPKGEEKGFQINGGVRVRGGFSRATSNPKHAMRLYFRKKYGEGKLRYPLFGKEGLDKYDNIDLRTAQNYSWSFEQSAENTFLREIFARDSQRDMGRTHTRSRYHHVYLNGRYWGIYQTQEHAEASYGASHFGGNPDDFDGVKSDGTQIEATDGTLEGWQRMWELSKELAKSDDKAKREALYQQLLGRNPDGTRNEEYPVYVDAEGLIDYMLVVFYTGSWDGPITGFGGRCRNWFGIWKRNGDLGFQYFCHDFEHSLGTRRTADIDRTGPFNVGYRMGSSNPQWIHQQLMASESYLAAFQQRAADVFAPGGLLSAEVCRARVNRRVSQIDRAIIAESVRWGGPQHFSRDHWRREVARLYDVLEMRVPLVKQQLSNATRFAKGSPADPLISAPLYPGGGSDGNIDPPEIVVRSDGASFTHALKTAEVFYTLDGSDPRGEDGEPLATAKKGVVENVVFETLISEGPTRVVVPIDDSLGNRWIQPAFDDSKWLSGKRSAGYELKPPGQTGNLYHDFIGVDLSTLAAKKNCTAYLRFPFLVEADAGNHQRLLLRMRYDDGFVAYLNGKEIVRANAPSGLTWNAHTVDGAKHDDSKAIQFEDFDVSEHSNLLQKGSNVLAIHAFNDYLESSDMLIEPALLGGRLTAGTVVPIEGTVPIVARVRRGTQWSLLARSSGYRAENLATAVNLKVSEFHYHPAAPTDEENEAGHTDGDDFEFIELVNIGSNEIDLSIVQLTGGVSFVFLSSDNTTQLKPKERCVLVKNAAAFAARYGESPRIAGEYKGKLANGGDSFKVIDAEGIAICEVRYNDKAPWPESADGEGPSLELNSLDVKEDPSEPTTWKASSAAGGTPGE